VIVGDMIWMLLGYTKTMDNIGALGNHRRLASKPRATPTIMPTHNHSPKSLLLGRTALTKLRRPVMGLTRPWVQSCWMEEIKEPAEE